MTSRPHRFSQSHPQGRSRSAASVPSPAPPQVKTIRPKGRPSGGRPSVSSSPKSPWGRVASTSAVMVLLLALTGIVGGAWVGMMSILSPNSITWVSALLPQKRQVTDQDLLAMDDIRAIAAQRQWALGEVVTLDETHIAVPFFGITDTCSIRAGQCRQVQELRIYRLDSDATQGDRTPRYRQTVRLEVEGPAESFVLSPWAQSDRTGSNQPLPLSQVLTLPHNSPKGGHWLAVSGRYNHGKATSLYGKVLRYHPETGHLAELLQWHSPSGQYPVWSQITGNGEPELIVDASTPLNPDFRVYEVSDLAFEPNPVTLTPISLRESVLELSPYRRALGLAQGKLWSQAHRSLTMLREELRQGQAAGGDESVWDERVQAQYDVIRYHAQVAQARADSRQAGSHHPVIAALADGQWQRAWERWQGSSNREALVNDLVSHGDLLWSRIETQLRVDYTDPLVTVWGALLLSARRGRPAAIAWYREQKWTNSDLDAQVDQALAQLGSPALPDSQAISSQPSN